MSPIDSVKLSLLTSDETQSISSPLTITEEIKTLAQLERHLGIRLSDDADFFREWLDESEEIEETDRQRLDQVRRNYLYI